MSDLRAPLSADRKKQLWRVKWAVRAAYLLMSTVVIAYGLQEQGYLWNSDECTLESAPQGESILMAPLYRAVLALTTNGTSDRVSVVSIDSSLEQIQQNVCPARGFTADLLHDLAERRPAVIAVDKFYGEASCPDGDKDTQALQAVAGTLPAQHITLVVGESTHAPAEAENGASPSCLVLTPQLDLGPDTRRGLTRLNQDVLLLPLSWPVVATDESKTLTAKKDSESFALVAATAGDPALRDDEKFSRMMNSPLQPYANLHGKLERQTAVDVMCSASDAATMQAKWGLDCTGHRVAHGDLAGKVVVVGAESDRDRPNVLGKGMYGFDLQAHYIAALYAHGYLRQVPVALVVPGIVLYYLLMELLIPYLHIHHHPVWPLFHIRHELRWTLGAYAAMMALGLLLPLAFHRFPPIGVMLALSGILVPRLLLESWMLLNERAEHPSGED